MTAVLNKVPKKETKTTFDVLIIILNVVQMLREIISKKYILLL